MTVTSDGTGKGNQGGVQPIISGDGKRVVYVSSSNNLDPRDTDTLYDVYVRELDVTPATYLVSIDQEGIVKGNGNTALAAMSADSGIVAFASLASNFVEGDWNDKKDVFVKALPQPLWRNPVNPYDVDDDGMVSVLDVLALIDDINEFATRELPSSAISGTTPPPYLDVDGDGYISPLDILMVINCINSRANGEGEAQGGISRAFAKANDAAHRAKWIDLAMSLPSFWNEPYSSFHRRKSGLDRGKSPKFLRG